MARKAKALVTQKSKATMSNVLNEMFFEKIMTLQELRFFLVYLSKLNSRTPGNTEVSYTLDEYSEILGVELNEKDIGRTVDDLLGRVVNVRPEELSEDVVEEIIKTPLFKRCRMQRRKKDNKWYLTFDCSDDVRPHIFQLTNRFTSIEIWNVINLANFQDARMYMLLRQYRTVGERTIPIKELKDMLGIEPNAYPEYKIFARAVLKKCQKALSEHTDIKFEFNAVGRPAKSVHFDIYRNDDYTLPKFLQESKAEELPGQLNIFVDDMEDPNALIASILPNTFKPEQVEEFRILAAEKIYYDPYDPASPPQHVLIARFLKKIVAAMNSKNARTPDDPVRNQYAFLKAVILKTPKEGPYLQNADTDKQENFTPGKAEIEAIQKMMNE